jgi:response regulator NasT
MPEMDGIEAAKIVSKEKIAPVVLLTAFSQPEFVKRASDAGVQAYLVKPVQEANLFPAIEVAMSRYQDMQGLEDELFKVKDTLEMRKLLDRAKGILMDAHNISESEAFNRIQKYSMAKRKTIKEVAEAIIRAATK